MQPVPRKFFAECPRCHSPAVRVPWEPARAKGRRRAFQGLAALWSTAIAWVALALAKGDILWLIALGAYVLTTAGVAAYVYRSAHTYRCTTCRLGWRV